MITLPQHFNLAQIEAMDNPHIITGDVLSNRLQLSFNNGVEKGWKRRLTQSESILCINGGAHIDTEEGFARLFHDDVFYCRIPSGLARSILVSNIAQRVFTGPYIREQVIGVNPDQLVNNPIQRVGCKMIRTHEEAFYTTDKIVVVGKREIDILKAELPNTSRKRIRLCCHPNTSDPLHEMFVLYTKDTYIQPNKHLAKEETFLILEGDADFIFYNETGDVTQIIPLGSPSSGKDFFVRVPQGVYHSVAMNSEYLVIHEATPGPYDRAHTVWAPWAKSQGSRS